MAKDKRRLDTGGCMGACRVCGAVSPAVARELAVCLACLRARPGEALPAAQEAHARSRTAFGLPPRPPKDPSGVACRLCVNECRIPDGGTGACGVRRNVGGILAGVSAVEGKLSWYHDPLPTNCVADWVCPGGTGAGFPRYARRPGPEYGCVNLAAFFHACSFDCLFCQNWQFRLETLKPRTVGVDDLVADVDDRTTCLCWFGGDPAPQLPFSLEASRRARRRKSGQILRICWETNGSMGEGLLEAMADMALESGGCIKFDLKAWDENVHLALTGVTNARTLANVARAATRIPRRPEPPLVVASTLMVPGYVDEEEVWRIARYLASLDAGIPYRLLAFHPHYLMADLPRTSREEAARCEAAAREAGLTRVAVGNVHLLA